MERALPEDGITRLQLAPDRRDHRRGVRWSPWRQHPSPRRCIEVIGRATVHDHFRAMPYEVRLARRWRRMMP